MATTEEIERRIEQADSARSVRRSAAATRVGELARRRAVIVEELTDIERELGDVLAESSDVIAIGELAKFTDVPAVDLTRWLNSRKTTKRKKPAGGASGAKSDASREISTARTPTALPVSTQAEPSASHAGTAGAPSRVDSDAT